MDFNAQLELVAKQGLVNCQQIQIDLATEIIDKQFNLAGNYFYILDSPDETSYISVKTNATNQPAIDWVKQTGFLQPFTKLYITTPAGQAGTMKVLIASMAPELFSVVDNRSAISSTMLDVLAELQGGVLPKSTTLMPLGYLVQAVGLAAVNVLPANVDRKGCSIQAASSNTGSVCLGFTAAVATAGPWFIELLPGMSFSIDDYRGPIWAIATVAAQAVGMGEW
jgi:hypothetical protein